MSYRLQIQPQHDEGMLVACSYMCCVSNTILASSSHASHTHPSMMSALDILVFVAFEVIGGQVQTALYTAAMHERQHSGPSVCIACGRYLDVRIYGHDCHTILVDWTCSTLMMAACGLLISDSMVASSTPVAWSMCAYSTCTCQYLVISTDIIGR